MGRRRRETQRFDTYYPLVDTEATIEKIVSERVAKGDHVHVWRRGDITCRSTLNPCQSLTGKKTKS